MLILLIRLNYLSYLSNLLEITYYLNKKIFLTVGKEQKGTWCFEEKTILC